MKIKDKFILAIAVTRPEHEVTDGSWIQIDEFPTRQGADQAALSLSQVYERFKLVQEVGVNGVNRT